MTAAASTPPIDRTPGYPHGWFMICFSDELGIGDVKQLRYFGEAMVLYRGEDGLARIFDAFCPHLGADLAAGGNVVGNDIVCPFHAWRFDGAGQCVEIPYCERIPKGAELRAWPVTERNGLIFVWYHPGNAPPEFDVPVLPNHTEEGWLPWRHSILRIKTHSREIVENVVDLGHFAPVHGTHVDVFENDFVDHKAIQRTKGIAYPRGGGKDRFELEATYYGPGYQISDMRGYLHSMLVNAHTMVDENTLDLRFGVTVKPRDGVDVGEDLLNMYVENLTTGFLEDVQIWENKTFRARPLLCADDGPIMRLRRWYAQFYR